MKYKQMSMLGAFLVGACSSADARIARECLAPRLTPSSLIIGDGNLDRGFPGGVSLVDVDGDGDLDLMATRGYSPIARPLLRYDRSMLYRNDGAGNFTHDTASALANADNPASGSTWGDVDGDGDLDAFVNTQHGRPDVFFRNLGRGQFAREELGDATATRGSNFTSSWVDIDSDGDLDLFVGGPTLEPGQPNLVYRNDDGRFVRVTDVPIAGTASNAGAVLWADLDSDGDQDLFIAYSDVMRRSNMEPAPDEWPNVYRNDGGWRFTKREGHEFSDSSHSSVAAALGDIDGDADLDLYLGHSNGRDAIFLNDGTGRFVLDSRFQGLDYAAEATSAAFADFDLDGDLDLVSTAYAQGIGLWRNDGTGAFVQVTDTALTGRVAHYWSSATGDIDGDGDIDHVIGNWGETEDGDYITILRNESPPCGLPVRVVLRDRTGTPDPIGARAILVSAGSAGERQQLREAMGQTTFRGQSGSTFWFGVPESERVVRLTIRWPDGSTQEITDLRTDTIIEIVQTR